MKSASSESPGEFSIAKLHMSKRLEELGVFTLSIRAFEDVVRRIANRFKVSFNQTSITAAKLAEETSVMVYRLAALAMSKKLAFTASSRTKLSMFQLFTTVNAMSTAFPTGLIDLCDLYGATSIDDIPFHPRWEGLLIGHFFHVFCMPEAELSKRIKDRNVFGSLESLIVNRDLARKSDVLAYTEYCLSKIDKGTITLEFGGVSQEFSFEGPISDEFLAQIPSAYKLSTSVIKRKQVDECLPDLDSHSSDDDKEKAWNRISQIVPFALTSGSEDTMISRGWDVLDEIFTHSIYFTVQFDMSDIRCPFSEAGSPIQLFASDDRWDPLAVSLVDAGLAAVSRSDRLQVVPA